SLFVVLFLAHPTFAAQSTITEGEGYACMGVDKSRKQTEDAAEAEAKRKATETAASYIKSETHVKDFELQKDLVSAYARATLKNIRVLDKGWYKDPTAGDCFRIKIAAEVVPEEMAMEKILKSAQVADDPAAPLNVQVWTDKKAYASGDKIRVYLKGNKPFFALVIFKDVSGEMMQLLPNPYRRDNYFQGGVIYEIPSGNDRFDLEVSPPFGEENIHVYAGTSPLGDIDLKAASGVYQVMTKERDIQGQTRAVKLKETTGGKGSRAAEFFEGSIGVKTAR
ncbi:MAG: DUF4384 domain-containing protein, partial [Smithellaceae bacterium]|nr:DUF4384 domain-containing protein [Smithellaceae bacterium]